ncbi:hypothetical protein AN958_09003 [Leucoagaricus sp. SymC.cos]|nr:hypothetical protein AN958_09003 [Leucoagaricus sp. SymC.cos]
MGLFVGGLAQFMAGMWEFPRGNVYGSAFFTLYGAFWISYATSFLVLRVDTFNTESPQERDAIGLYLIAWFIVTCFFFITVLRANVAFIFLTFFWGYPTSCSRSVTGLQVTLRGAFGFVTAIIALHIGLSQMHKSEYSLFTMPIGTMGRINPV